MVSRKTRRGLQSDANTYIRVFLPWNFCQLLFATNVQYHYQIYKASFTWTLDFELPAVNAYSSSNRSWAHASSLFMPDLDILCIPQFQPTGASLESPVLHENEQHRARSNGRIVGKQAQMIPTQGSTKVQVAASMIESRMNGRSVTLFQMQGKFEQTHMTYRH
jgi:hypothetical protein